MLHADSARNRLIGIGFASAAFLLFSLLDTSAKWLVLSLPLFMVVWLRFVTHVLFATVLLAPLHGRALVRTRHLRLHLLRALMFMTMTGLNFLALQYLQLTVTASIFFAVPLITAVLAARLLGEKLDPGRWIAILTGFAGVLLIVRPGTADFHPAMLLAIANAFLYAAFNMTTRHLAAYDTPETIQYLPALGAAIGLTPFALAAWQWPSGWLEWTIACLLGIFGGLGHHCLTLAHRYAPASIVAPFLYQQVFYMAALGYLVFGDVPHPAVWTGAAIVIGSGLYLFARERSRAAPAAAS
ncbi:MAG TPA: DMT family transporter [Burkholderiales bacterium]|nr:DMT family transporter [Burkholderiales bacterium]